MAAFALWTRGPEVLAYQRHLKAMGFDPGPLDGIYGPRTQAAEAAFNAAGAPGVLPPAPAPLPPAPGPNLSAKAAIAGTLGQFGLGGLADWAWNEYLSGKPVEQIMLDLRQRSEYKTRFPAMETLSSRGRAISEAEYIGLETQYTQLMRSYGLPAGFYDGTDDFAGFISKDVSPVELQRRLDLYQQAVFEAPRETRDELRRLYGVDEGGLLAFYIDADRALPLLQKQFQTAQVSGLAQRAGLADLGVARAERFAGLPPEEIQRRIDLYVQASFGMPIETKQELARLYGITDLTGFVTDPDRAIGALQQQIGAAFTAGAAIRSGFGPLGRGEAERLAPLDVSDEAFRGMVAAEELFKALPGQAEQVTGRGEQIDILAGEQQAIGALEKKRARRKAEFEGGGGFAQTARGVVGLTST